MDQYKKLGSQLTYRKERLFFKLRIFSQTLL